MGATIKGQTAVLRWGYHVAAQLGPWSVVVTPERSTVTADIVQRDEYKSSQQPLKFVVERPGGHDWVWPIESAQMTDGTLTASLGPVE